MKNLLYKIKKHYQINLLYACEVVIKEANELNVLKTNNLAIYGFKYSKSFEYARLCLRENFLAVLFSVYFSLFLKLSK